MFFHVHYEQAITWFLLQFGVIGNCKIFKDHKLHLPYRLVQFCYLWKIYLWLLTPNYTQSHVSAYTNKTTLHIPISHFKIESLSCKRQGYICKCHAWPAYMFNITVHQSYSSINLRYKRYGVLRADNPACNVTAKADWSLSWWSWKFSLLNCITSWPHLSRSNNSCK